MPKNTVNPKLTTDVAGVLRRAADYIASNGLNKAGYFAPGTRRTDRASATLPAACAIGAISYGFYGRVRRDPWGSFTELTSTPRNGFSDAVLHFEEYIDHHHGNTVSGWNDHPDRTPDDVSIALRSAADDIDRQPGKQR